MKLLPVVLVSAVVGACAALLVAQPGTGYAPLWAEWLPPGGAVHSYRTEGNVLGGVVIVAQHAAMPRGGPQGFEAYVYDDHPSGTTRLVIALPQNVEIAGTGHYTEVRGGGVKSGDGTVDLWRTFGQPVGVMSGTKGWVAKFADFLSNCPEGDFDCWFMDIRDARIQSHHAGRLTVGELAFPNGVVLRQVGNRLEWARIEEEP